MFSDEVAIRVTNLSKRYEIYANPRDRLKQFVMPSLQRASGNDPKQYFSEFWAVKNISFEIKKGETFGIIGRNGSGKSTLLQMICGTLSPTSGSVETIGRIAALLELGSGFNPEFTGRENIYMNASVLGLTNEEIDMRFNDIVAFADIGDFIDQPVKTYSSGMYVRLAFAVIAHVDADILVIDEALSVGDIFFQQKCMRYLRKLQDGGGTVIFVSHDTSAVLNLCNKAILISRNKDPVEGKSDEICQIYIKDLYAERNKSEAAGNLEKIIEPVTHHRMSQKNNEFTEFFLKGGEQTENIIRVVPFRHDADFFGQGGVEIIDAWFSGSGNSRLSIVNGGDLVDFFIKVRSNKNIQNLAFGFMIKDRLGQYIFAEGSDLAYRDYLLTIKSGDTAEVKFNFLMPVLIQGEYSLNVAVAEGVGDDHIQHHWVTDALALHSLKSRLVHGICGLQNLTIEIKISSAGQLEQE
jgi:lipopolysaccharide transport system ATP-binding protein